MSLMKAYAADMEYLTERAMRAAWEPTSTIRIAALTEVFEDCGTAAKVYKDPFKVAENLVTAVTTAFLDQRKSTTYQCAG